MQSFSSLTLTQDSGYFHIWINTTERKKFFEGSLDKAFFLGLIQDALSPRANLNEFFIRSRSYAKDIDLLAYSLSTSGVHLLLHTTRRQAIDEFGQLLLAQYCAYLQNYGTLSELPFNTIFTFDRLAGRHEALCVSKDIHLLHQDWRHDRYSSIGFYLDDRRGDWMRPYRLIRLFDNNSQYYEDFLASNPTEKDQIFQFASLARNA